ncbi:SH2 domain [Trinorchestia longiramus]|nr:SH2 domain [Trinorchestia longiramus]
MERLAAPAPVHHHHHNANTNTWSNSATLPHPRSHPTVHQHHYQYHVQQHPSSSGGGGRDVLNTSLDSSLGAGPGWHPSSTHESFSVLPPPPPPGSSSHNISAAGASSNNPLSHSYSGPSLLNTSISNNHSTSSNALHTLHHSSSQQHNALHQGSAHHSSSSNALHHNAGPRPQLHHAAPQHHSSLSLSQHLNSNVQGHYRHPSASMDKKKEVKLNSMEWFHRSISRDEAEKLLQPREDGLFLVRESTNFPGDYTLCVCYQNKVEHYRVIYKNGQLTIDEEEFFLQLTDLVAHYEQDADGLCTQLTRALPKQGNIEYGDTAQKAFKDAGWVINRKELKVGDSIGKGEFGDVLLGDWLGRKVAVKRLKGNCRAAQQLLDEASLMTSLTHDNLVELLGVVFEEEESILLVTEYMSKGSLVDYLRSRGRLHVTKRNQIMFACDTAAGMAYLESRNVVHRDLAARNVLISHNDVAKVSDFGLAKSSDAKLDGVKFPIKWTAPEALRRNMFSNKSDMWSFGILLWEIYSFGRVPYPKIPLADVMKYVEKGYRMDPPDNCPQEVYAIMSEAWRLECDERPTFKEVLRRLEELKEITPA